VKKVFSIIILIGLIASVFATVAEEFNNRFIEARKYRDKDQMLSVIKDIENTPDYTKDSELLTILADSYLELATWGVPDKDKEKTLEKARSNAELAIKLDQKNGRAHYIAGASIGRLAQYKGIVQSLFMLGDFDRYIDTSIKLLDENDKEERLYKTFAYLASGMRYRDVPWPLSNYKKSEELLNSALKLTPNYSNIYLELGYLYLKTGNKNKAKEMFQKVISMDPHPLLIKTHEEAVKTAKEEIEKLK
jgi:tetratricopeptide (TPR) repeat protein